ncbi:hypothetical protein MPER_08743, partial [Moniliophthora perniciosa FA553]
GPLANCEGSFDGKPNQLVNDDSTNFLRGSQMTGTAGSIPSARRAHTQDIRMLSREYYGKKAHHRLVMEHAGRPLQDERNLRTVVACIGKASIGLSFMFSAGMVHRDISTGNLLVSTVKDELVCEITDLEYAKEVGDYLFEGSTDESSDESSDDEDDEGFVSALKERVARRDMGPSVRYNYLHDLDSLFWILMYFLFIMHPADDELDETVISLRMRKFRKLFPSSLGFEDFPYNGARIEFLRGNAGVQSEKNMNE